MMATSALRRAPAGATGVGTAAVDLRRLVESAFAGPAWHGPALRSALRGVAVEEALWLPAAGRNRIWDLALHAAYAKHRLLGRLDPTYRARFPRALDRQWWPRLPADATAAAWRGDLALLDEYHGRLRDLVAALPPGRLAGSRRGVRFTLAEEVAGVALHDTYHGGQVRLIRRLYAARRAPARRAGSA